MDRVLQVIGGLNRAGAETMLMNYYRRLDKQELQFDFLIYKPEAQDFEAEIVAAGGRVLRISAGGIFSPLQYVVKIFRIISQYGPYKAIHIHTLHNGAWALLAALPFPRMVRVMHSHSTANPKRNLIGKLYNVITKFLIRLLADKQVACGENSGEYLFGKKFPKRGTIIQNGIDVESFGDFSPERRAAFCAQYQVDPESLLIVCVGRLLPMKNHAFAVEIAGELRRRGEKFALFIAGAGNLKEELQKQISAAELDNQVHLIGSSSDIPGLLSVMDVYLMPSLFEGLPVSLIEAQAAGLPSLVSDVITPEADLGLNLVFYLNLQDGAATWAKKLLQIKGLRNTDRRQTAETVRRKGYDVKENLASLLRLYEDKK